MAAGTDPERGALGELQSVQPQGRCCTAVSRKVRADKGLMSRMALESLRPHQGQRGDHGCYCQHDNDLVERESTELQSKPKVYVGSLGIPIGETQIQQVTEMCLVLRRRKSL